MGNARRVIIAYDISGDTARSRVLRLLRQWRLDGQKSVHECRLTNSEVRELFQQMVALVNEQNDTLLLAWLAPNSKVVCRGLAKKKFSRNLIYIQ